MDPNYQNAAGYTPLSLAAEGVHLNLVHFLLANGASPLLKDAWGGGGGGSHSFMQPLNGVKKFPKCF